MYGIILILVVIGLSGLIAYLGDQIGMKVGKKRISLFGLRPKYTSIIITILTGILIASLTITIILATNNAVRRAIFDIHEVTTTLNDLNQKLLQKDKNLREKELEINSKEEELNKLQGHLDSLQRTLEITQQEYEQAQQDIRELETTKQQLENQRLELQSHVDELQSKVAELDAQRQNLESKIEELNKEIARVTEEYEKEKEKASQFKAGIEYYMGEEIVYERGEVIYYDVIRGGRSQEEIIQDISAFLKRANEVVKQKPVRIDEEMGTALQLQFEQILSVASTIFNADSEKVIVSLVASYNVPRNNWVLADFQVNEDFIVFKKGEFIAGKEIDASQDPAIIEQELKELLKELNVKAVREGLLTDKEGLVGSIDFSQFYEILSDIRKYKGRVEVKVYAREDIWREDRLSYNLVFDIKSIKEQNDDSSGN
jgi:uncharacterized phage infection (PIP) family protein YhgE